MQFSFHSHFIWSRANFDPLCRNALIGEALNLSGQKGKIGGPSSQIKQSSVREVEMLAPSSEVSKKLESYFLPLISNLCQRHFGKRAIPCNSFGYFKYSPASQNSQAGHYDWHCDAGHMFENQKFANDYPCRKITFVYYPHENFTGGQFILGYRSDIENNPFASNDPKGNDIEFNIQPSEDCFILFPSDVRYPHKVEPVQSGFRLSVVNWFDLVD